MIIWDLIGLFIIAFVIFVASCVVAIFIYFWMLVLEAAGHIGNQLADLIDKKQKEDNKGSGN
jgi:hypothetical protein